MVFDIFSKRERRLSCASGDVYQYTKIPEQTRVQIIHLWKRTIGSGKYTASSRVYVSICDALREEYGVFNLTPRNHEYGFEELANFFLTEPTIEKCLDVIELSGHYIAEGRGDGSQMAPNSAIDILNARLREGNVGFQYENGVIIKVSHQLIHAEVVKPVLEFLSDRQFAGANEEFLQAHRHYRSGEYKACLVECLKSFESTMKIICKHNNWPLQGDTAAKLIATLFANNFIPPYLQAQFNSLKAMLESGVPTIRNKTAGHGQGDQEQIVPDHLAAYVLHQTASAILFLIKSYRTSP